jgi:hypothetical protein
VEHINGEKVGITFSFNSPAPLTVSANTYGEWRLPRALRETHHFISSSIPKELIKKNCGKTVGKSALFLPALLLFQSETYLDRFLINSKYVKAARGRYGFCLTTPFARTLSSSPNRNC